MGVFRALAAGPMRPLLFSLGVAGSAAAAALSSAASSSSFPALSQGAPLAASTRKPLAGSVVLVTGSSRGLGLEFVAQLLERGCTVIATCRTPERAPALQALADADPRNRLLVQALDTR